MATTKEGFELSNSTPQVRKLEMPRSRRWSVIVLLLVLSPLVTAQTESPFRLTSKSELVLVPTVVSAGGEPLRGLNIKDFEVRSNGKLQQLSLFQEISISDSLIEPTGSDYVVRNRLPVALTGETTIIVVDYLNARNVTKIHRAMVEVLGQFAAREVPVSVLAIGRNGLVELHSLGASNKHLRELVRILGDDAGEPVIGDARLNFSSDAMTAVHDLRGKENLHHSTELVRRVDFTATTLLAVEEILRAYAPLRGRKKLIWIAQQVPQYLAPLQVSSSSNSSFEAYKEAFGLIGVAKLREGDHDLASHWNDPDFWKLKTLHGFLAWRKLNDSNFRVFPVLDEVPDLDSLPRVPAIFAQQNTLITDPCQEVADYNGYSRLEPRRVEVCYNNPSGCARMALEDKHYYLLGFYLRGKTKPGVYKLQVKVPQKNARVSTRQGYAVMPGADSQTIPQTDHLTNLNPYFSSPLDSTEIPLVLQWRTENSGGESVKLSFEISTLPDEISVGSDLSINVLVAVGVRRSDGAILDEHDDLLNSRLSTEEQQRILIKGFRYGSSMSLRPGNNWIRILVKDVANGRVGTVTASVVIKK